jgi:hypothetical protein
MIRKACLWSSMARTRCLLTAIAGVALWAVLHFAPTALWERGRRPRA